MSERLRFKTARDLFDAFPTAAEDMAASPSDRPVLDFISGLLAGQTPEDGITFCAYLLGKREAVWWGRQCLNQIPNMLDADDHQMIALAENWVRYPEEDQRNAALEAGMGSRTKSPGVWIALAAGWSGGSMLDPDAAPVVPPPYLTAKAVNAGILSGLARVDRKARGGTLRAFVGMGVELATRA
jgi:hypothetical protein